MQRYRQRKKEKEPRKKDPISTRSRIEKQRSYWRVKKREQRERMTPQAKRREKERRKMKRKETKTKENIVEFEEKHDKTGKLIKETHTKIVARLKTSLKRLKTDQTKEGRKKYRFLTSTLTGRYAVENSLRKELDIKWDYWVRCSQISDEDLDGVPRSNKMPEQQQQMIEKFYVSESVTLPTKKTVSLKTDTQKRILTDSIQQAHSNFLKQHSDQKISLSKFRKMRPKEILTVKNNKFVSCLCEYCLNVKYKIEAIDSVCRKAGHKELILQTRSNCVDKTMCPKKEGAHYASLACIHRECGKCTVNSLRSHFQPMIDSETLEDLNWKRWELREVEKKQKGKVVKEKRQILIDKHGKFEDILNELCEEVNPLALHLFTANWQYTQFNMVTSNMPKDWVVMIADFAENYRCVTQDEIQSAYYSYQQVTVFPIISYYRCLECDDVTHESAVFIAEDLQHDVEAVKEFTAKFVSHLRGRGVQINKLVQFSDGCANQFKSKRSFMNMTTADHDFERAFFGSRHGKGPCDALGGLVKKSAETFVKSRNGQIRNSQELFKYCEEHLKQDDEKKCTHNRRVFFYYKEIPREEDRRKLQPYTGTRKMHSMRTVEAGIVKGRELSCFCEVCIQPVANHEQCRNINYIGEWKKHNLLMKKGKDPPQPENSRKRNVGPKTRSSKGTKKKGPNEKECAKKDGPRKLETRRTTENSLLMKKGKDPTQPENSRKRNVGPKTRSSKGTKKKGPNEKECAKKGGPRKLETRRTTENIVSCTGSNSKVDISAKMDSTSVIPHAAKHTDSGMYKALSNCKTYEELRLRVYSAARSLRAVEVVPQFFIDHNYTVDKIAAELIPSDLPCKNVMLPVRVKADGNCLPRCGSIHVYGDEQHHEEMRARVVMELVINEETYLDYHHLAKGVNVSECTAKKLPAHYAAYSSRYTPADVITPNTIRRIYQQEVMDVLLNSAFMGIWQLFALANVFQSCIWSIYPQRGNPSVRNDLNRMICPVTQKVNKAPVFIMWTSTRTDMEGGHWIPNHFVPLLTMEPPTAVECSFSEDEDLDLSCLSGLSGLLDSLMVEDWPWVTFFSPSRKGSWTPGTIQHTVVESDVQRVLDVPDIQMSGTRIHYQFVPTAGGTSGSIRLSNTCSVDCFLTILYVHLMDSKLQKHLDKLIRDIKRKLPTLDVRNTTLHFLDKEAYFEANKKLLNRYKEILHMFRLCDHNKFGDAKVLVCPGMENMFGAENQRSIPFLYPTFLEIINSTCSSKGCCQMRYPGCGEPMVNITAPPGYKLHSAEGLQSVVDNYMIFSRRHCADNGCSGTKTSERHFPVPPMFVPIDLNNQNFTEADIETGGVTINRTLSIDGQRYALAGIVFYHQDHFTAKVRFPVDCQDKNTFWYYEADSSGRLRWNTTPNPQAVVSHVYYVLIPNEED